ncbi:hypothetical protein J437_LFUL014196 [Ladona fulva]|uniref:Voltage-dependent anion-selective channel n=1 Tax=Ladona fulva TaxID=123851 RepID=A0A8K0KIS6_LADFU|nr:hypothetical protein J437_LFUL014196 [Ladona fulva]
MAPPSYGDLGKAARDVFGSGYHFGLVKLELNTKTEDAINITAGATLNQESGRVFGSLETRYKVKDYGMVFTERWNTDNALSTEISVENKIAQGLKMSLDTTFVPHSGKKSGRVKTAFKHDSVALNMDMNLGRGGPVINGSTVFGYNGWLAGYQMSYDYTKSKITKNNFAVGFTTNDFVVHSSVNDGEEYFASLYQQLKPNLETGIQIAWSAGSADTRFEIGCKYQVGPLASLRAKVDNSSRVGLAFQQKLSNGISMTMSALIDGKSFYGGGGHKLGMSLDMAA